jgi:hypothetical protein
MIALVLSLLFSAPTFCDGYRQGFAAAYCAGHSPECLRTAPVPACTERPGTFQDGYDQGYTEGERVHPAHNRQ